MSNTYNYQLADAQATAIEPLSLERFPLQAYADYAMSLRERCRKFWNGESGVLVYRRMRVASCFSEGCRDAAGSLRMQLGALAASMQFPADIPNFLEPWYGIGTIASAFGADYHWAPGQAPAVKPRFESVDEALSYPARPVSDTPIGSNTLRMIELFVESTDGRLPISLTDSQSPWNIACNLVNPSKLFMELIDRPDRVRMLLQLLGNLLVRFTHRQLRLLGGAAAWPGHGFGSCWDFQGLGMSDDNILMLSEGMYRDHIAPSFEAVGQVFGGAAFHSCGNWSGKMAMVRRMAGLRMVDAAFLPETDPKPNPPAVFRRELTGSGIVLNARMVGGLDAIIDCVKQLWAPGMKLIVATYCQTPEEQAAAYDRIHAICRD